MKRGVVVEATASGDSEARAFLGRGEVGLATAAVLRVVGMSPPTSRPRECVWYSSRCARRAASTCVRTPRRATAAQPPGVGSFADGEKWQGKSPKCFDLSPVTTKCFPSQLSPTIAALFPHTNIGLFVSKRWWSSN